MKPPADQSGAAHHAANPASDANTVEPGDGPGPAKARRSPLRRLAFGAGAVALPVLLGGCGLPTFWGYRGSTTQAHDEFLMYAWTFIAALVVGGLVALLMIWAIVRYRRRSDEMPRQFQYHGAVEVLYTIIPIVIVLVIFGFTVVTENNIDALSSSPAVDVKVTAFQWGWEFEYPSHNIVVLGHTTQDPDLVLPSGQTSQITLVSQDVVHGFYVPQFNFSRYAQPGVTNLFDLTPKASSTPKDYRGQCTQLCGLYHALMFFHVTTLPPAQFQAWLARNTNRSFIGSSSNTAATATGTLSGSG